MKFIILFTSFIFLQTTFAQHFPLPSGITYRAFATHYDCGVFGEVKAETPEQIIKLNSKFTFLAADKRINDFLIELNTMQDGKIACYYGVYLTRNREDRTLYYESSKVESVSSSFDCEAVKNDLDLLLQKLPYEGSRRGLRYLGVTLSEVESMTCNTNPTRVIFDRRYNPSK